MHRVLGAFVLSIPVISSRWAWSDDSMLARPQITVSVYNDAHVPQAVLHRAEERAATIFANANVEVDWVNCLQASEYAVACTRIDEPGHLSLRIIADAASSLSDVAFGIAFLSPDGAGKYCDVFWKRAEHLHATSNLDLGGVLGSVMAHEMGHLLLGSNAHAVNGIMRARWEGKELRRIAMGTLLFTSQQSGRMRGKARLVESGEQPTIDRPGVQTR